ncbi:MAG: tetratricopeptide repeat protein [Weeksellaceae bacterium]|nr:tetratricopeptide repeat protein [Weeksellaceae bacterium]
MKQLIYKLAIVFIIGLSLKTYAQDNFSIPRDTSNYSKIRIELSEINKEIKKDSSNCFLYFSRNLLYFELLQLQQAKNDLSKAISLCPNDTITYFYFYQRGSLNDKLNLTQEAFNDFSKSIELKPDFEGGYLDRGTLLTNSGYFKEGRMDLHKALALKPNWADAYFILGTNYDFSGEKDSALVYYEKSIDYKSDKDQFTHKTYNNIGAIYNQTGKFKEAIAMFDKALEIEENYTFALTNRAESKYHLGDKVAACKDLKQAIGLGRTNLTDTYRNFCN